MHTLSVSGKILLIAAIAASALFIVASISHAQEATGDTAVTDTSSPFVTYTTAPADTSTDTSVSTTDTETSTDDSISNTDTSTDTSVSDSDTSTDSSLSSTDTDTSAVTADDTTVTDTPSDTSDSSTASSDTETVSDSSTTDSPDAQAPPAPAPLVVSEVEPELSTDKPDYYPGQTASIFGRFFQSLQNIVLHIFGDSEPAGDNAEDYATVTTDETGSFTYQYQLDDVFRPLYTVVASALDGTELARTTFTDAIGYNKGVYNKSATAPDDITGGWTTGNAGDNYLENQWAYYQYQITGITSTVPDFDVTFNHYQSNSNAIFVDAFSNFRACVDCTSGTHTTGPDKGMLLDTVPYPTDITTDWKIVPIGTAITNVNDAFVGGVCSGDDADNTPSDFHCFHVDGSGLALLFPGTDFSTGTHTISLFYADHMAATFVWSSGNEADIGDDNSIYYVNPWPETMPEDTAYGTEAFTGWSSSFNGVGSATGSSRHFEIENQTAGSQGGLTLPIPTVPLATGQITIVKVTDPASAVGTVFGFTGDLGVFNLDTDPDITNPNTITFSNLSGGIPFNVTESSVPTNWSLTSLSCVDNTGTNIFLTDLGTETATITLDDGGEATCTFTNSLQQAHLTLQKTVTKDNGGTAADTDWTLSASGPTPISGVEGNVAVTNAVVNAGTYNLSESAGPAGYTNGTTWVCTGTGNQDDSDTVTLDPGENATCVITNTDNAPSLTLNKVVVNDNGGTTLESAWTLNAAGPTPLSGPGAVGSADVVSGASFDQGTYTLSESPETT